MHYLYWHKNAPSKCHKAYLCKHDPVLLCGKGYTSGKHLLSQRHPHVIQDGGLIFYLEYFMKPPLWSASFMKCTLWCLVWKAFRETVLMSNIIQCFIQDSTMTAGMSSSPACPPEQWGVWFQWVPQPLLFLGLTWKPDCHF